MRHIVAEAGFGDRQRKWYARPGATADSEAIRRMIDGNMRNVVVWSSDQDYLKLGGE